MPPKAKRAASKAKARERKERKLLEERIKNSHLKCEEARAALQPTGRNAEPNFVKAKAALTAAIEVYDTNPNIYYWLGECHRMQGEFAEAVEMYSHTLDLDVSYIRAIEGRAACYQGLHNLPLAIEDYTSVIDAEPNNDHAFNMRGLCILNTRVPGLLLRQADFKRCESDFKTAIRLNEANYYAQANLGKAYEDQGEMEKAIASYTASLAVKQDYTYARFRRGCTAMRIAEKAILASDEAVKEEPAADGGEAASSPVTGAAAAIGKKTAALPQSTYADIKQQVHAQLMSDEEKKAIRRHLDTAREDFNALLDPNPEANKLAADVNVVLNLGICALLTEEFIKAEDHFKYAEDILSGRGPMVEEGVAEPIENSEMVKRVLEMRKEEVREKKALRAQAQM